MIDDIYSTQIKPLTLSRLANCSFLAQQRYARNASLSTSRGCCDGARIVTLGQNNVLQICRGTLAYAFE